MNNFRGSLSTFPQFAPKPRGLEITLLTNQQPPIPHVSADLKNLTTWAYAPLRLLLKGNWRQQQRFTRNPITEWLNVTEYSGDYLHPIKSRWRDTSPRCATNGCSAHQTPWKPFRANLLRAIECLYYFLSKFESLESALKCQEHEVKESMVMGGNSELEENSKSEVSYQRGLICALLWLVEQNRNGRYSESVG